MHYEPSSLFDESDDVPRFNGVTPTFPPGPQILGASERFDLSRQVDVIVNEVSQSVIDAYNETNQDDWASFAAIDFPNDPLESNDDSNRFGEEGPYSGTIAAGTDNDMPDFAVGNNIGGLLDEVSIDLNFREFARINIGDKWYAASDPFGVTVEWRMIRLSNVGGGTSWRDAGGRAYLTE